MRGGRSSVVYHAGGVIQGKDLCRISWPPHNIGPEAYFEGETSRASARNRERPHVCTTVQISEVPVGIRSLLDQSTAPQHDRLHASPYTTGCAHHIFRPTVLVRAINEGVPSFDYRTLLWALAEYTIFIQRQHLRTKVGYDWPHLTLVLRYYRQNATYRKGTCSYPCQNTFNLMLLREKKRKTQFHRVILCGSKTSFLMP